MTKKNGKRYTAQLKFQVVMEMLKGDKAVGQIARAYGVWKKDFHEHGPEVFGGSETVRGYEQRLRELERLVGQKEVEIALLKNFLAEN